MKKIFFAVALIIISFCGNTQVNDADNFYVSLSAGNFIVGHGYIKGIWTGAEGSKKISIRQRKFLHKLTAGGELYFENGADKATIYNPSPEQFIRDRYYHESNTGITIKLGYYPFGGFMKGFHIATGPLLVYSIRTYEKRAELIQYSPSLFVRMAEIGSDNKLLAGYRLTAGYDIYFAKNWFAGIRADFLQYHNRDLNSLWGIKAGYRF